MKSMRVAVGAAAAVLLSGSFFAASSQRVVSRASSARTPILVVRESGGSPNAAPASVAGAVATVNAAGVAQSVFSQKEAAFFASGSTAEPCRSVESLPAGDYVFGVTNATGTRLLSTEPASERVVTVGPDGIVSAAGALHTAGPPTACGSEAVPLAPFSDAGGEEAGYILWVTPIASFGGSLDVADPACGDGCFHGFRPEDSRTFAFRVEDKRTCSPTFCVSGVKFEDENGNGDREAGEEGLAGVEVRVTAENGIVLTGISGEDGSYRVCGLTSSGTYRVTEVVPFGFLQTGPLDHRPSQHLIARDFGWIVETCQGDFTGLDFANQLAPSAIGGVKFEDRNANGVRDAGEPGLEGVTITLTSQDAGGPAPATAVSDASGNFLFSDVAPGSYVLSETVPAGFTQTSPAAPGTIPVTLAAGESSLGNTFGNFRGSLTGTVSGFKFNDANGNGARDGDEAGLPGVSITISGPADFVPQTVVTGPDGAFSFPGLRFATYTLSETVPSGFVQTAPPAPGTITVTLSAASPDSSGNLFGNQALPASGAISGQKIFDLNANGVVDGAEGGLEGVVIVLTDGTGFERRFTTGPDGTFSFTGLPAGTYVLSEILPPNFFQTFPGTQAAPGTYTITLGAGETRAGFLFLNKC